jgi:hypothetical protein
MGRPLNKKYFGNRNTGSASVTTDDGIGGKKVASVTITTPGSYTTATTVAFSTPDLTGAGAVRATGTIVYEGLSAVATVGGTGYLVGDLLTVTTAGGSAIAYVATLAGDGSTGEVATVNFTGTGASRGSFTSLAAGAQATTDNSVAGANCTLTVTYRVKSITITEQGSGYTDAADAAVTFAAGTAAGTAVLETDSGSAGSSTNQENAIVVTAFIPAADGGTAAATGDIVKQTNDKRYKVKTSEGTGICQLKTTAAANAAGEMSIKAIDSEGKNYLVAKLTSRKVVLVPAALGGSAGTQFASGASAKWTFGSAVLNDTVTIENA